MPAPSMDSCRHSGLASTSCTFPTPSRARGSHALRLARSRAGHRGTGRCRYQSRADDDLPAPFREPRVSGRTRTAGGGARRSAATVRWHCKIGKTAHQRGLEVDSVSWPIGAIPDSAKIGDTGRALAYAIARQESAFNVGAIPPANAQGLLQLLPGTAKMMAKKTGQPFQAEALTTDAAYNATRRHSLSNSTNFGNSYILTSQGTMPDRDGCASGLGPVWRSDRQGHRYGG